MKNILSEAAQSKEQERAECLVVILMSHGDEDVIEGVDDEEVNLVNDVYAKFNNENCKSDGGTDAKGHVASDPRPVPAEEPQSTSSIGQKPLITWSDMYIAYAAIPGYVALRNGEIGSWFLSAVYKVFSEHAGPKHLLQLMELVHAEVLEKEHLLWREADTQCSGSGLEEEVVLQPEKICGQLASINLVKLCVED
ncbi:hypothetical protein MTO96_040865 [Rhipicephalus appendiculatus]